MTIELKPSYDVVISGAGPCGATIANLLGMQNVSTLLIDKESDVIDIPRAVGMCDEGSRILASTGVFKHAPIDFVEVSRTNFTNAKRDPVFHFDMEKRINSNAMQRTFYQPQLENSIRKAFERFSCVDFSPSSELTYFVDNGDSVDLTIQRNTSTENISCKYLIGCDGASSPIRKQLNIGFSGKTYRQDWLIIDIEKNPLDNDEIDFSIDPNRPGITLPLPHNKRRWEFVVKKDDNVDNLFSKETLSRLLAHWGDIDDMVLERKAIYSFHARTATRYTQGNVFLAGDAAHITPPFAGQGMMAGLRDAQNLSWKLAGVIHQTLDKSVLDSYDAERVPQSKQIIKFAQMIGKLILPQSRLSVWLRDAAITLMTATGIYSKSSGMKMDKIPNHINGSLLKNFWISKTKGTGTWFPQYMLSYQGQTRPSDEWMHDTFYIASWNHNGADKISTTTQHRWSRLDGQFISIYEHDSGKNLVDINHEYGEVFGTNDTLVIRPDKMIVINCKSSDLESQLNVYLNRICIDKSSSYKRTVAKT
jgi:3-(3-hydroxy-phenyl)propionate hydroxylase